MGSTGAVRAAPHPHSPIARHVAFGSRACVTQCGASGSKRNTAAHGSCSVHATVLPGADGGSAVSRRHHCEDSGIRDAGARLQPGCGARGACRSADNALRTSSHHCMSRPIYRDAADVSHRLTQYLTQYLTSHCEQYCDGHVSIWPHHWHAADYVEHGTHTCGRIARYVSNAIGVGVAYAATPRTPQIIVRKIIFAIRRVAPRCMSCRAASHIYMSMCAPGRRRIRRDASTGIRSAVYGHTALRVYGDALAVARHSTRHGTVRAAWHSAHDEMPCGINGSAAGGADTYVRACVRPRVVNAMQRDTVRTVSRRTTSRICSQTALTIDRGVAVDAA